MFKGISIYEFRDAFKTEEDCLVYLSNLKWLEGYKCMKCNHDSFYKGKTKWYRKCQKCAYDESVKSNTMFHKMKLPLLKTFEILFFLSVRKKGMSTIEISKTYAINQNSAWLLKRKAQQTMRTSGNNKLQGKVHVDEITIGGKEKKKQGRSNDSKKVKLVIACEVVTNKKGKQTLGNAYAQVIQAYSSEDLKPIFDTCICKSSKITTDKWSGYLPIIADFDIIQEKSKGGENFKELNNLVMLLKGWIRGIHHHVSKEHMDGYINEFFFKFNRKSNPKSSFNTLLKRMMVDKPMFVQFREVNG
jgi:hypothetical protein